MGMNEIRVKLKGSLYKFHYFNISAIFISIFLKLYISRKNGGLGFDLILSSSTLSIWRVVAKIVVKFSFLALKMTSYYDIDDILAEEEMVPAVFLQTANEVGIFDCADDTNKVEAGTHVEMPFWLAQELYVRQVVSIKVPPYFDTKAKTRNEIGADAAHVDLRSLCPYFYDFGCKIARLIGEKTIGPLLLVAFRTRYREVLIKAHTAASIVAPKHFSLLTKEETKLYEAGQSSTAAFKKWRMGGPRLQKASVLGRKRKPVE
ncbi:DNA replication complex GINS protein PSF3-like [Solanum pennellii]|nr:DNA replication complex GINS protein PSF3-like [Solanum pennellii]